MKLEMIVVDGDRQKQAFSNPVINWQYLITTGPRCKGLLSKTKYKSVVSASIAGERMLKKLQGK